MPLLCILGGWFFSYWGKARTPISWWAFNLRRCLGSLIQSDFPNLAHESKKNHCFHLFSFFPRVFPSIFAPSFSQFWIHLDFLCWDARTSEGHIEFLGHRFAIPRAGQHDIKSTSVQGLEGEKFARQESVAWFLQIHHQIHTVFSICSNNSSTLSSQAKISLWANPHLRSTHVQQWPKAASLRGCRRTWSRCVQPWLSDPKEQHRVIRGGRFFDPEKISAAARCVTRPNIPFKTIPNQRKVRELPRKRHIEEVEQLTSTMITKQNTFETIPDQRKVRELPWKRHIEEVEQLKSTMITMQNTFKTIPDQRRVRELPWKRHIEDHWRSWTTEKYDDYHAKHVQDHPRPAKSTRIATKQAHWRSWTTEKHDDYHAKHVQDHPRPAKSTRIATKKAHWRSWTTEKYHDYHAKHFQDHPRPAKSTRIATKKAHWRNWTTEKYENYYAILSATSDQTIPEHRKVQELARKMHIEEAGQPETTRITMQIPFRPTAAKPKVWELPRKMEMQARNYENCYAIRSATPDPTPLLLLLRLP